MPSFPGCPCSPTVRSRLTEPIKHNILCRIAVSGTSARPKRESGANPELPRSGNWERPCLGTEPLTSRPGFGKRHVRNEPIHSAAPGSPKTCRDLHLTRGAVRLWSSRGRSDRVIACTRCARSRPFTRLRRLCVARGSSGRRTVGATGRCSDVSRRALITPTEHRHESPYD